MWGGGRNQCIGSRYCGRAGFHVVLLGMVVFHYKVLWYGIIKYDCIHDCKVLCEVERPEAPSLATILQLSPITDPDPR